MTEVKLTDGKIHELSGAMGLDQHERALFDAALRIYMRKYGSLSEDRVKELLRHLESAGLMSGGDKERALKKVFEGVEE